MDNKTQQIAALNDHCRQCVMMPVFGQRPCKVFMTQGIAALPPEDQIIIVAKVRDYDDFSEIQIIERNPS